MRRQPPAGFVAADDVQRLVGELFGLLDAGARGGAHAQRELSGIDGREDRTAQGAADNDNDQRRPSKIGRHDDPSLPHDPSRKIVISVSKPVEPRGTGRMRSSLQKIV